MGIKASQLDINTQHINELAYQIENNTDCEVLRLIIDEHLDSIRDLFDDMKDEQTKILQDILPLLQIPGANPAAIVTWIKKFVAGQVTPQLRAHIKYTKKIISLGGALLNVIQAIKQASRTLPNCAIELKDTVLDQIEREVTGLISDALLQVAESQSGLIAIVGVGMELQTIDTSSTDAFINTVDAAFNQIENQVQIYKQDPLSE